MRAQDFIADETVRVAEGLIHQVTRMGDKSTWKPMDEGRTALDQVAECALISGALVEVIKNYEMPDFTAEMMERFEADKSALDLAGASKMLRENTAKLCEVIRDVPDEKMTDNMKFWGPDPWMVASVLNYHNWNMTYHVGQVNYIQTLYGDKEMG